MTPTQVHFEIVGISGPMGISEWLLPGRSNGLTVRP
jgi:hypothetical protein